MHIGLITFEQAGHLHPMTTLGATLRDRGHRVTLLGRPVAQPFADRAGIDFAALGTSDDLDAQLAADWRELGRLSGLASMRQTGRVMAATSRLLLRHAPAILRESRIDALLVDQLTPAGLALAGERPVVIVCNALVSHYDPYCPPPPLPWRYRRDLVGRMRNALAARLIPPVYDRFADAAASGIRPLQLIFEQHHGLAHISQQPAFFDFPRTLPDHFHYTAPWHRRDRDAEVPFPWDRLDGRPLIYASMGTLQNNVPAVFAAIAAAVDGLDVQMVLTQGGCPDDLDLVLPGNVLLVKQAPQLPLLDRATLAITHAGLNTTLECLVRGVPMVCLPVTNDQPGVARRVEWLGLGEMLPVKRVTAGRLRALIEQVLGDPLYRAAAHRCRERLVGLSGPDLAADVVLEAFETGRPVLRREVTTST